MRMNAPRFLILQALLLDTLGQVLILWLIFWARPIIDSSILDVTLAGQEGWLFFSVLIYPFLNWLFGGYTVLRWRNLTSLVLLQRLLVIAGVSVIVVAVARWLLNPGEDVWIVYRRVQFFWMVPLIGWSFLVRIALRQGLFLSELPQLLLFAQEDEVLSILSEWNKVTHQQQLDNVITEDFKMSLNKLSRPLFIAVSPWLLQNPKQKELFEMLEAQDPRSLRLVSLLSLFEKQQERLPTLFMDDFDLNYEDISWTKPLSMQVQLKRIADIFLALLLLFLTGPFIMLAALLIWLEDQGPAFYCQKRSGWLGKPFTLFKLRTMSVQPQNAPAEWTSKSDSRITTVGAFLRKIRLDELPQLYNVVKGEMSLIGPRPERPELELVLETKIPYYRKRHWIRPGLSGWAQVSAPYASSIDASDLKLSYDLYYLKNFSTWLDLIIVFRTVKTVLKASGR